MRLHRCRRSLAPSCASKLLSLLSLTSLGSGDYDSRQPVCLRQLGMLHVLALDGNGGGRQLKLNQMLQPDGGVPATNAAKLDSQIVTPILLAHERAGGRTHWAKWALNNFGRAVCKLLFLVTVGFMIAGANAQIPEGSSELKTFANLGELLAKTNVKVAVGTIVAIVGGIGIAGTCMHSRRPAFTQAGIADALARGPTVPRRDDPTFEIYPSIC